MKNNYWEELKMNNISEIHNNKILEMNIPKWMNELKCPYCEKIQPVSSIRQFGMKLNSRNIGDFFLELCCYDCKIMNTLYFRKETKNIGEFIALLTVNSPVCKPIVEENMYAQRYNNLIEDELNKNNKLEIKCQ